jgi:uncharacterized membrane protein YfcA
MVFEGRQVMEMAPIIAIATVGVVAGTLAGTRILRRIPEHVFLRIVAIMITLLGVYMLGKGAHWWS